MMIRARLAAVPVLVAVLSAISSLLLAQPAARGEIENLVPPGGAAFDLPVHAGAVCILSFPGERVSGSALTTNSKDFEVKAWGSDGVAVLPTGRTPATTLALATESGAIKINVTLHVVPAAQEARTLVRFKAATTEQAIEARVAAEVARRTAPIAAELERTKQTIDVQVRDRAEQAITERLLKRMELISVNAHERNDDNVIAHVQRAIVIGDDGYLFFEVENQSGAVFRVARASVSARGKSLTGVARLFSAAIDKDPSVLGVVPAGTTAHGIVVVRAAEQVRGVSLDLELADPSGRKSIRLTRGVVLK